MPNRTNKKDPDPKYTIGELSQICNLSTKTLRHYDEKGVLRPLERGGANDAVWSKRASASTSLWRIQVAASKT